MPSVRRRCCGTESEELTITRALTVANLLAVVELEILLLGGQLDLGDGWAAWNVVCQGMRANA